MENTDVRNDSTYTKEIDLERSATSTEGGHYTKDGYQHRTSIIGRIPASGAVISAFGGAFQPDPPKPSFRKFGNPGPLGLCAFALTTFVLSLINVQARGVSAPNIVVSLAYAYGGLVQLLAGMWEMAVGNTFGATAFASYGGFWISYALIETSGSTQSYGIVEAYEGQTNELNSALGFYLLAWVIFTTMCVFFTLKSTLASFAMFLLLDLTYLLLAISHFKAVNGAANIPIQKAAGVVGIVTSILGWWNALAGIAERSNSFFTIPVFPFPWGETVKPKRKGTRID
ncbi:putative meiotically up-regulated gene 86 protein [Choiromyces venosus 120613-1]|uniref:Putative meiotically up-regulated gene 86 protein n=1 Tax=Choiromyces venosus 120613-1 TaxID=1336337 RepID=A0A3N4J2I7_9PEZI|nr:putative meiotically up-regulated gene 86 protein [Choiromyces venosus 120613-1]